MHIKIEIVATDSYSMTILKKLTYIGLFGCPQAAFVKRPSLNINANTIEKIKLWFLFAIEIIDTQVARRGRQYHSQPTCHLIRNVSKVLYKKKQYKINKKLT